MMLVDANGPGVNCCANSLMKVSGMSRSKAITRSKLGGALSVGGLKWTLLSRRPHSFSKYLVSQSGRRRGGGSAANANAVIKESKVTDKRARTGTSSQWSECT